MGNITDEQILKLRVEELKTFPYKEFDKEHPTTIQEAIQEIGIVLDFLLTKELKRE